MAETMTCYRHPNRETGVSCSECGRGICPDCMRFAPVGIRCPEHAGGKQPAMSAPALKRQARATRFALTDALIVTKVLIGANVAVFLINLAQGASLTRNDGNLFADWALFGPLVANGDWWRLLTSAFLHASLIHLAFNMLFLWWIGGPMEAAIGHARFVALYLVSALAGAAGALLLEPEAITVGASGALFGILGAAVVFERQGYNVLGGQALGIVLINLAISFIVPNISIGGHVGGFVGGALCGLVLSRFGKGHGAYGRVGLVGALGFVAVGVASVLVAYWTVRGYA
jgi:membrane associated rhomboid family serine protease